MSEPFDPAAWSSESGRNTGPFPLLRLKAGTYQVRILDGRPTKRWVHFDAILRQAIQCAGAQNDCALCRRTVKRSERHYVNVLDRRDGEVKVMVYPAAMADRLEALIRLHGDPRVYDIQIIRRGQDTTDTTYTVARIEGGGSVPTTDMKRFDLEVLLKPAATARPEGVKRIGDFAASGATSPLPPALSEESGIV